MRGLERNSGSRRILNGHLRDLEEAGRRHGVMCIGDEVDGTLESEPKGQDLLRKVAGESNKEHPWRQYRLRGTEDHFMLPRFIHIHA